MTRCKATLKCGPQRPCERCASSGTPCSFALEDGRTKEGKKRALEEMLQGSRSALVDVLRDIDKAELDSLLDLVEAGSTASHLPADPEEGPSGEYGEAPKSPAQPNPNEPVEEADERVASDPVSPSIDKQYPDPPFIELPCQPWTEVIDDSPCTYFDGPDKQDLSEKFLNEARVLWEVERGRSSLTNLQGLMCLSLRHNVIGNDRMGWLYLTQGLTMYKDLERKLKHEQPDNQRLLDVVIKTGWIFFNLQATTGLALMRPVDYLPPKKPYEAAECGDLDTWQPYPLPMARRQAHSSCGFAASLNPMQTSRSLQNINQRLQAWQRDLPKCMSIQGTPPPHVFCTFALFFWAQIVLFGFLIKTKLEKSSSLLSIRDADDSVRRQLGPKEFIILAARKIATLDHLYAQLYGFRYLQLFMLQSTTVAAFRLLSDLEEPSSRAAFSVLCRTANASARLWPLSAGALRMVQQTAKEMDVDLPPESRRFFDDFESEIWSMQEVGKFSGDYPNFLLASGGITETQPGGLAAVLSDLNQMSISE
ncbi:MAG: hypothetical protein Q9160_004705 [Pyrenula sp. 1 TL-2023]